ncbi:MAG TPA: HAMP domain-containing sensor histidine kinase [Acidobacteriota bacterium]|nr:HAMP domain-containing sensor histidine kinase [Acidobacteriota bacterium]
MRRLGRHGDGVSRHGFLFVLLLATLVLTGLLAYQALEATFSHRATAESVLNDYTALAAHEFVRRSTTQLGYYGFYPALRPLAASELPDPAQLQEKVPQPLVRTYFRLSSQERIEVRGRDESSFFDSRVITELLRHSQDYDPEWQYALLLLPPEEESALVYRKRAADPDLIAEGFITDSQILGRYFEQALQRGALLPPSLGGGKVDNSLLSISVSGPGGRSLFKTRTTYASSIRAYDQLGDGLRDIGVVVSLNPQAASQLVIGGLPYSRIPILLGLLILSSVLILAALLQLHRERDFSRRQADFIAAVSHELRTPLAQIQMFSETLLLKRVRSESEERRSLEIISQETKRLANLVDNVIQFTRSLRRKTQVTKQPTRILPLLRELRDYFAPLADSSGCQIRIEADSDHRIRVDSDALRLILLNLVDNAVKYGPDGQTVRLGLARQDSKVRIWVEDEGEGIQESERERIWKRFERLPRHRSAAPAGTGIGLSVVRELTEAQGGEVWVEAGRQGGARFVVEFAAPAGDAPAKPQETETEP